MSDLENEQNQDEASSEIRMKVIGVGGAGSNIVDRLLLTNPSEVHLSVINTDEQALEGSPVLDKLCIGKSVTHGLGTGGDPEIGLRAAEANRDKLLEMVKGVDLLFIATGLGGGTGTGVSPMLADLAVQQGVIVIAFAALPFTIERAERSKVAKAGLERLRDRCNAVIPLPNDLLIQESDPDASLLAAFAKADAWIESAIKSIWSMLYQTGLINLDFSQLRQAFAKKAGKTLFGLGRGEGADAAKNAIEDLKMCPLLHTPEFSKSADHLLVNIVGGPGLGVGSVQFMMEQISEEFGKDANVVMGAVLDENQADTVEICVIGTSDVSDVSLYRGRSQASSSPAVAIAEKSPAKKTVRKGKVKVEQHEFSFSEGDPKGEFENLDSMIFEGQDLDTPTFMRKGIKILL